MEHLSFHYLHHHGAAVAHSMAILLAKEMETILYFYFYIFIKLTGVTLVNDPLCFLGFNKFIVHVFLFFFLQFLLTIVMTLVHKII